MPESFEREKVLDARILCERQRKRDARLFERERERERDRERETVGSLE